MKYQLTGLFALCFSIDTWAEVVTDGSLGAIADLTGPDFQIESSLGQQQGSNLFHSFQDFNLNPLESATFIAESGTDNIIARVTGGASNINGLLNSPVNLYFFNPAGIVIGPSATLNIQGALHLSTAETLQF
ncbi:MAG: filamentous hemagglutinin N-terminal domain-containing protein, partial [Pseudomonadota bacterium]